MKAVLTLENPSDELLKAFKSMATSANVKFKLKRKNSKNKNKFKLPQTNT